MKYVITNNLSKVYDTKEEAEKEFQRIINSLSGMQKGAFAFLYTIAPYYE